MRFFTFLLILFLPLSLLAQKDFPHGLSEQETFMLQSGLFAPSENPDGIPAPPPYPVRTMAEWEELEALVITWPNYYRSTLAQIVRYAKDECEVIIVCQDSNLVKSQLLNQYLLPDLDNISFLEEGFDSIWIRDFGPNCVYANDVDSLYFIDWIYNRPLRPLDNILPDKIGAHLGIPVYTTTQAPADLVNTGGNFLNDGMGTAFASELILEENEPGNPYGVTPKSEAAIDQIMSDYMGIDRFIKMPVLPYDDIHHLDMHWFLLDEETFVVGQYPEGTADGPQIEANLQYVLNNFMSPFGTPYKVIRIQMPPAVNGTYPPSGQYRTYTNGVFVNKTLIVPVYDPQYDEPNLQIFRDALPGYKVVGIDCNSIINSLGAIHCITKPIGVADPLLIQHQPLADVVDPSGDFEVNATIRHRSGINEATLYFTTDTTQGYTPLEMTLTSATDHVWTGYIPAQTSDTEIFYYIEGESNSGKVLTRPLPAPQGYWNFDVTLTNTALFEVGPDYRTGLDPIFPNPASAITCIPVQSSRRVEARIELIDMLGRTVHTVFAGDLPEGETKYFIHANGFEAGTYIVRLQTEHQQQLQKLIIR